MKAYAKLITSYLQTHLPQQLKDDADQFTPILSRTIKAICKSWLVKVQENAREMPQGVYKCSFLDRFQVSDWLKRKDVPAVMIYDKAGIEIICDIFQSRYQIRAVPKMILYDAYKNSLMNILPEGQAYNIKFKWAPDNPHVLTMNGNNFSQDILEYLKKNLPPHLRFKSNEYLAHVTSQVNIICQKWLERVQEKAEPKPKHIFMVTRLPSSYEALPDPAESLKDYEYLDREAGDLLIKIFQEKFGIYAIRLPASSRYSSKHSLCDALPQSKIFNAQFLWKPTNPYIYAQKKIEIS